MLYVDVDIDIVKQNHEAFIIDKSISFSNSQADYTKLTSLLEKFDIATTVLSLVWRLLAIIGLVFILIILT
jgi:hypothetical protein